MTDAENKITVEFNLECDKVKFDQDKFEDMIKNVRQRFGCYEATVSTAILDNKAICQLNSRFLGKQAATDVISFDVSEGQRKHFDLAVNAEMAVSQAQNRGHKAEAELALYIIHGLLHNLGFDDSTAQQAQEMHEAEDKILQQSGYGQVYNNK